MGRKKSGLDGVDGVGEGESVGGSESGEDGASGARGPGGAERGRAPGTAVGVTSDSMTNPSPPA